MSNFTKMDFSRETSTREVFENAHLLTSLFSLSCFFPFWQVLQETAGRSGRRTGRKGSRNHQIYHPPWQWHHNSLVEMLAFGGTVPHPQTLRTFMLSTLEVSHRNPMATLWPGFQISAMLFFVEHSCSFYKDDMMAGRIPGMHTLVQKYLDISVCCCRWAAWVSCVQEACGSCTM